MGRKRAVGGMDMGSLTVVYWIMTLFSSSGLKSVFFWSVDRMCFIWPTMQFSVLETDRTRR